jgi:hypothetical protein
MQWLYFDASALIKRYSQKTGTPLNLQQVLREAGDELMLWTSDKRLVRAAQGEGVTAFDPEEETIGHLHQLPGVSEPSAWSGNHQNH